MAIPSFFDIASILTDEKVAINYLAEKSLLGSNICQSCGGNGTLRVEKRVYRCTKFGCRKEWTCLRGTFFSGSRLPVHKILFLSYHWIAGARHDYLCDIGGFGTNTVSNFFCHLQQLVGDSLDEEDCIIGGEGIRVEMDESKFGKRKFNRGHRVDGVWIFGGVEITESRKVFLCVVDKRDAHTLRCSILKYVRRGSIVVTDFWRGYLGLEELGYTHLRVNHSVEFVDSQTGACTNTIEGTWSALKRSIPIRNRTVDCGDNLWEFIWRRKHKTDLWGGFLDALDKVIYE
jgi:hypothetical protein